MTLTAIRPHALGLVADAGEAVGRIHTAPPASLSSAELAEMVVELSALAAQVDGLRLAHAGEADARGVAHESADTGADAWLARLTGEPREVMAGGLWVARMLRESCHHTRSALEDGRLRLSQAKAIVRAVAKAPSHVTAEQLAAAEESWSRWPPAPAPARAARSTPVDCVRRRDGCSRAS